MTSLEGCPAKVRDDIQSLSLLFSPPCSFCFPVDIVVSKCYLSLGSVARNFGAGGGGSSCEFLHACAVSALSLTVIKRNCNTVDFGSEEYSLLRNFSFRVRPLPDCCLGPVSSSYVTPLCCVLRP